MSLDPLSGDTWSSRDPMGPPSRSRSPPSAWTASTASTQTPATLCPRTRPEQQKRLRINITYIQLMSVASAPLQKNKKILSMLVPCKIPGAGNRQNQLTNRIGLRGILLSAWVYPYNWQLLHCLGEKAEFAIINFKSMDDHRAPGQFKFCKGKLRAPPNIEPFDRHQTSC